HLDQLVVRVDVDPVLTSHKVENGDVDVDLYVPPPVIDEIAGKYGVNEGQFFSIRGSDMFYTLMNTESPLFKDNPQLRQAVNFALDRTEMLRVFAVHGGSRTDGYLPRGLSGFHDVHPYPVRHPDLAKAVALAR